MKRSREQVICLPSLLEALSITIFDLIYGVSFIQNEIGVLANNLIDPSSNFQSQYVNYTMQAVQINLLGSFNIINNHLSIEAGPVLNVNGKLKIG